MDFKAGIYNADGSGITGSSDLKIKIKRDADDLFYDFNDSTFKASLHTTIAATMTEVSVSIVPGEYEYSIDVSSWDDGVYTCYFQYSGTNPWTDAKEFRVYDGKEAVALVEELGTQAKADVNAETDTALTDYDPPTRAEATTDKEAIITEVDANETKIDAIDMNVDSILVDTNEIQGKLPTNYIMGSTVITAKDDEIDAIKAKTDNLPADPADDSDLDTQLAAIQADVDTLLTYSLGAGSETWTYTLTDADSGAPIADADIWITSDAAGTHYLASGRTNQNGVFTCYLDTGTIYVWRQKTGFNFVNPDQEEVN